MSWWASSAEEFRKQFTLAVSPSQKLQSEDSLQSLSGSLFDSVTTLAEQSEASLRASADRAATSAQLFASQTDEGLQTLRGSLLASANSFAEAVGEAMPLTSRRHTEKEVTAEELAQRFESEAALLSGALRGAVDGFMVVSTLGSTFKSWEERLAADAKDASRRLAMPALRALMRTSALKGVLEALMAAAPRHRVLRRAAEFAAAAEEREAHAGDGGPEEIAGEQLVKVLSLASVAPSDLQRDLLLLLVSATEAADRCRGGNMAADGIAAEEDVRWLTQILSATLPDCREADTLAASRLCESIEQVLAAANAVCQAKGVLVSGTPVPKPPRTETLAPGAEVWACWPGTGAWYRATVHGTVPKRDRVQVMWLRPAFSRGGPIDEYLSSTGCDETLFTELSSSCVMLVEETIRRPPPTPDDGYPADQWETRLAAIESHSIHFNELHSLGKQLECHKRWSSRQSSNSPTAADQEAPLPLTGAANTLQAMRVEAQERAEALGYVASECADEQLCFQEQIKTSTGAMAAELQALQKERSQTISRAENLRFRREELLEQLRLVNEELTEVESARVNFDLREQHLKESMTRVAEELAQQVDQAKEHGVVATKRQHVIEGSLDASRAVEEQLAKRSEAVAEATDTCSRLNIQEQLVGVTCLTSDRARCLELQELLAGWHESVWGPEAGLIPRDPERASSLRAGHLQALGAVEDALREVEHVAADSTSTFEGLLGFNSGSNDDEKSITLRQMNRAMNSYKDMRQQLKENLQRLAELESCVPGTHIDPSIALARLSSAGLCKPASPVKAVDGDCENQDGI